MKPDYKIVIPARYASTRFPGKPLEIIAGKTMLQWTYEASLTSGASEVYIATDDERIKSSVLSYTDKVLMTSTEHQNGTERLAEVVKLLGWDNETIVVNVQGDEPLIKAKHIELAATSLADSVAEMSTLCYPINDLKELFDPNIVKVVRDAKDCAMYFSRAPIPWQRDDFASLLATSNKEDINLDNQFRHIGMYAYRAGLLDKLLQLAPSKNEQLESLEQLRALHYGIKILVAKTDEVPGIGVDVRADLVEVEKILSDQIN